MIVLSILVRRVNFRTGPLLNDVIQFTEFGRIVFLNVHFGFVPRCHGCMDFTVRFTGFVQTGKKTNKQTNP